MGPEQVTRPKNLQAYDGDDDGDDDDDDDYHHNHHHHHHHHQAVVLWRIQFTERHLHSDNTYFSLCLPKTYATNVKPCYKAEAPEYI
jgi:hypothetical protein